MSILGPDGRPMGGVSEADPVVKLSHFVEHPEAFGQVCVMPGAHPDHAPLEPFEVVWTDIKPDERYGVIKVDDGDTRNPSNRQMHKGDIILHIATGVYGCVKERIRHNEYRIEAWSGPRTDDEKQLWMVNEGKGDWVCAGFAWETEEELPWHTPEVVETPEDIDRARKDTFRHPEREGWAKKFMVGKPFNKLKGKEKKRMRQALRSMMGTCQELRNRDTDEVMEENATQRFKTKMGREVVRWTMGADGNPVRD